MSADDDRESKTLEPTETKIRKAIEEGRTPAARDVALFASICGLLILLALLSGKAGAAALTTLAAMLDAAAWRVGAPAESGALFAWLARSEAVMLALLALAALLALGIAASCAQGLPHIAWQRVRPQWSRVSPGGGLKRIFGAAGRAEFLKTAAKFLVFAAVIGLVGWRETNQLVDAIARDPGLLPDFLLAAAVRLVAAVAACTALIALGDIFWSRFSWRRDLRMSHQEVKEEFRQQEGDPFVKSRLRALAQGRARRRMMAKVPRATLVVVNPTHYAVALRYDRAAAGAPVVVAKGLDLIALKIREVAARHEVPVIEDKPLARALHAGVEVDQMIPPEFYRAVAEMICLVAAPRGTAQGARRG